MTRNPVMHDRIATAILDAAAEVLAERGDAMSMTDVATAAGIGRTTLYRYFPNRDTLLRALFASAIADLNSRFADAGLAAVGFAEGLTRVTRATFAAAGKYRALSRVLGPLGPAGDPSSAMEMERRLREPLRVLFQRGREEGALRADLPTETLLEVYIAIMQGAFSRSLGDRLGLEEASASIIAVFLSGALTGPDGDRRS